MASSKSLRKGQFPIVCQLCEVDMKLKWKCEDRDLLVCDRCREKVHPKFKRAKEHHIIDFKQVGTCSKDLEHSSEFLVVKCEKHKEQDCCLFCQTCDQLICVSCVTKTHKPHELVEIPDACKIKRKFLAQETHTLETKLVQLDEIETRVEQVKDVEISRYEKVKQEIYSHQTALKNEVDRYTCELIDELNSSRQSLDQTFETRKKQVNKIRGLIQKQLTLARNALAEKNAIKTLQEGNRMMKALDQSDEQPPFYLETISVPKFVPSDYKLVHKNYGSLQNTIAIKACTTDFKIKRNFKANMRNIHYIVACTKYFWIGYQLNIGNSLLQQVTQNRDTLQVLRSHDVRCYDIALHSDESFLLCVNESKLKQVDGRTGKMSDSIYDVSPLVTRGVHVTNNNQIVIAAKNIGTPFPVSGRRVVITMNERGKQTAVYEHDKTGRRLFTYPERLTSNSKGYIFVVDILSGDRHGRIVVLKQGQADPSYVYSGCSEVNSEQFPFNPSGLVSTPSDNIILSDSKNQILHILNSDGHLISLCNVQNIGVVDYPYSLSINPSGLLYIGCLNDNNSDTAKLYELEYSGC